MENLSHNYHHIEKEPLSIPDPEDAREFISKMIERGESPCVSVPEEYLPAIKKGLVAYSSWIPDMNAIVGTLGRKPYLPNEKEQKRVLVYIKRVDIKNVQPRFTGPDKSFHGVVIIHGPIPPQDLEVKYIN